MIQTNEVISKTPQQGTEKINRCDAKIIDNTLKLLKEQILVSAIKDIGIITPYKAQNDLLKNELKSIKDEYKK